MKQGALEDVIYQNIGLADNGQTDEAMNIPSEQWEEVIEELKIITSYE